MIRIELTEEQAEALAGLQAEVDKAYVVGSPGAIWAQVWVRNKNMHCHFMDNAETNAVYDALAALKPK